ncbi:MAG: MliC family protein [Methylicorpusculum sp.]|uniref:MliC family protein n=1 Tax=Methylicorpusculum sp. TaxID=2713644 RepID=UPI002721BF06|nr:MliC family protein [Methylicorpusculum sp.]MDO8844535.1 MliC family protein [Methylicorpusculum sp.]MDO8941169.1 MliC family protein [Methylicorpusculum sp.]MDO9240238.1 MliC family protein [Methylicorpusculum sp.]MDP2180676.1 MliC family protein [Methylicorpusculum sp.]MDP2201469.1 MliC family protein [Methylicorpusculum sp.]
MHKSILLYLLFSLALLSCKDRERSVVRSETRITENRLVLVCDNGYDISAIYYAPDSEGRLSKLSLKISRDGKTEDVEMIPAIAASGAKFETPDRHRSFWEHQGEFALGIDDKNVSVCRQAVKKTVP